MWTWISLRNTFGDWKSNIYNRAWQTQGNEHGFTKALKTTPLKPIMKKEVQEKCPLSEYCKGLQGFPKRNLRPSNADPKCSSEKVCDHKSKKSKQKVSRKGYIEYDFNWKSSSSPNENRDPKKRMTPKLLNPENLETSRSKKWKQALNYSAKFSRFIF